LNFKKPKFTPVIFHNLTNYDSHLFIKNLGKSKGDMTCTPNNEKKYLSFSKEIEVGSYENKDGKEVKIKHEIRFIDSFKFMASSLDGLVSNLVCESIVTHLCLTKKYFPEKIQLITRKGVYPYDYMSDFKKFKENQLPPKEAFYLRLYLILTSLMRITITLRECGMSLRLRTWVNITICISNPMSSSSLTSLKNSETSVLRIMISIPLGISPPPVWPGMPL